MGKGIGGDAAAGRSEARRTSVTPPADRPEPGFEGRLWAGTRVIVSAPRFVTGPRSRALGVPRPLALLDAGGAITSLGEGALDSLGRAAGAFLAAAFDAFELGFADADLAAGDLGAGAFAEVGAAGFLEATFFTSAFFASEPWAPVDLAGGFLGGAFFAADFLATDAWGGLFAVRPAFRAGLAAFAADFFALVPFVACLVRFAAIVTVVDVTGSLHREGEAAQNRPR